MEKRARQKVIAEKKETINAKKDEIMEQRQREQEEKKITMQIEAERTKRKIEHNIKMREMERQNL